MENPRPEKVAVVEEVKAKLEASTGVILTEYRGLDVSQMSELRKAIRAAGAEYKVYKNTLVRFAAQALELDLDELLTGPTGVAFATPPDDATPADAVALAKALTDFAKDNESLVVKGGLLGGDPLDVAGVSALAKTPPRAQLYAEFLGAGLSFYQDFAGVLDAKLREFSYAMAELADKGVLADDGGAAEPDDGGEAGDDAAPAADEAPAEASDEAGEAATDSAGDDAGDDKTEAEAVAEADDDAADGGDTEEEQ